MDKQIKPLDTGNGEPPPKHPHTEPVPVEPISTDVTTLDTGNGEAPPKKPA